MKITLLLLLLISSVAACFAQKEATHWLFGDGAGIKFINGNPVPISGKMFTEEGCATISSRNSGQLLFYTNGDTVWNANNIVMENGLELCGGWSSSQSAIIIPVPYKDDQYYIFSVPDLTSGNVDSTKAYYSVVDMQLNNQTGGFAQKNIPLIGLDSASERIACTFDNNRSGFWVVVQHAYRPLFYSYHITAGGIAPPVISSYQPSSYLAVNDRDAGCMKISPNGKKLAITSAFIGFFYLFDFDNKTGKVSNLLDLFPRPKPTSPPIEAYGLSFSPDNSKLYGFYRIENAKEADLYQFEVDKQDNASILNSKVLIEDNSEAKMKWAWRAMQLAPNGKIYCTRNGFPFLSAIRSPNLKGNACDFHETEVNLFSNSEAGLPNFIDSWLGTKMSDTVICSGGIARIGSEGSPDGIYNWSPAGTLSNPTAPITEARPLETTMYYRTFTSADGSIIVDSALVTVDKPIADAGNDKTVCYNGIAPTVKIGSAPLDGYTYSWTPNGEIQNPESSEPIINPTKPTQYIVRATSPYGCSAYDTMQVNLRKINKTVSRDTAICKGTGVRLSAGGGTEYMWSPSIGLDNPAISNPVASPDSTTEYRVIIKDGICIDSGIVTVKIIPLPEANAGPDNMFCDGIPIRIGELSKADYTYSWQPTTGLDNSMSANPLASPKISTSYIVTVTGENCSASDTVYISVGNVIAKASNDTAVCLGSMIQLFANGGVNYIWSPSSGLNNPTIANPICIANSSITYMVIVSNGSCSDTEFIAVSLLPKPQAQAGKDTVICTGDRVQIGDLPIAGNTYLWTPATGLDNAFIAKPTAAPNITTQYIVSVQSSNGCSSYDTAVVTVNSSIEQILTLDPPVVSIFPGQSFVTTLHIPSGVLSWNVRIKYDSLIVAFDSIIGTMGGIVQNFSDELGQLSLNGKGRNTDVMIRFNTFLPNNFDTVFIMDLVVDSFEIQQCDTILSRGCKLEMGEYCGRKLRAVKSSSKSYFLKSNENMVNIGVGLSSMVRLELYDYTGTPVRILIDDFMEAGEYSVNVDLPTGVYFCVLKAGQFSEARKMVIVR